MKKVLIVMGCILGFLGLGALGMIIKISSNMKEIKAIEIENINFTQLEDGEYTGAYYYEEQIGARVNVVVENGEVTNIVFVDHIYGLGEKAEKITDDIISNQSLLVDDVAGATTSSHVIKLAIENALEVK